MPQDRHIDDPLGGVFRHSLKQAGAVAQGCPPTDLLAAYFERSLTPAESSAWEKHFSVCTVCQEQLAVLARIESTVGAAAPAAMPSPRFSFLGWRWLAPTFAAAGVLAIWIAVRPTTPVEIALNKIPVAAAPSVASGPPAVSAPASESAKEPAAARDLATAPARTASPAALPPQIAPPATDALAAFADKNLPANQVPAAAVAEMKAKVGVVAPAETGELRASADEKKDQAKKEAALEAASGAAAFTRSDAAHGAKRAEAEKSREGFAVQQQGREQVTVQAQAPSAATPAAPQQQQATDQSARGLTGALASNSQMRANEAQRQATVGRAQEAPPKQQEDGLRKSRERDAVSPAKPEFVAHAGRIQWKFFADGRIERYDERLKSGDATASPVDKRMLAASAPSEKVCWAVGREGAILRSVNAAAWQVIGSPADEDLVFVEARDEQNATVRTASGKSYATTDGGKTWRNL